MMWAVLRNGMTLLFFAITFWAFLKAGRKASEVPDVQRAIRRKLTFAGIAVIFVLLFQPVVELRVVSAEWIPVVKSLAILVDSLVSLETTNVMVGSSGGLGRLIRRWGALLVPVLAASLWWWPQGTASVLLICAVIAYYHTAMAFLRYGGEAENLLLRWQFRTLWWTYLFVVFGVSAKTVQTLPYMPEWVVSSSDVIKSLCSVPMGLLGLLGYLMPKWYARLGYRLLALCQSQPHLGDLVALSGRMHDRATHVTREQREALAGAAIQIGREIGCGDEALRVIAQVARVAPVRFRNYHGGDVKNAASSGAPGPHHRPPDAWELSVVWKSIHALMNPYGLPSGAPLAAKVVRAAALKLDGCSEAHMHAQTGLALAGPAGRVPRRSVPESLRRLSAGVRTLLTTVRSVLTNDRDFDRLMSLLVYLHDLQAECYGEGSPRLEASLALAREWGLSPEQRGVVRLLVHLTDSEPKIGGQQGPKGGGAGSWTGAGASDGCLASVRHFARVYECVKVLESTSGQLSLPAPIEAQLVRTVDRTSQELAAG